MRGSKSVSFIDFVVFSFAFDRVCCGLLRSFLVPNWCGAHLVVGLNELQPYPNAGRQAKGVHAEDAAYAKRSFPNLLAWPVSPHQDRPALFSAKDGFWRRKADVP
jgi:hypothetical protein